MARWRRRDISISGFRLLWFLAVLLIAGVQISQVNPAFADAIIDFGGVGGLVQLGVADEGTLSVVGGSASSAGTQIPPYVGVRYMPTNAEAIAIGAWFGEGWGVAAAGVSPFSGYTNNFSSTNVAPQLGVGLTEPYVPNNSTGTGSTASQFRSVVDVTDTALGTRGLRVTHDFHPSASPRLYQVDVTIANTGSAAVADLRYRRVLDWDVEPTARSEFVTIGGLPATNVIFTNDNGFSSADPLVAAGGDIGGCGVNVNFTDCMDAVGAFGGSDHGALFDLDFGGLAAGASRSFKIFYGAAGTEAAADAARAAVGIEVYSYGQCNPHPGFFVTSDPSCSETTGTPNTFIFGLAGVGGTPASVPEPSTLLLLGSGLAGVAAIRRRKGR